MKQDSYCMRRKLVPTALVFSSSNNYNIYHIFTLLVKIFGDFLNGSYDLFDVCTLGDFLVLYECLQFFPFIVDDYLATT